MNPLNYFDSKKAVQKIEELTWGLEKYFKKGLKDRDLHLKILAALPVLFCYLAIAYSYNKLNDTLPLWYTKTWGEAILTNKINLYLIPLTLTLLTSVAFILSYFAKKFYFTFLAQILLTGGIILNTTSLLNVLRIINIASLTSPTQIPYAQQTQGLVGFLALGFLASYLTLPRFTAWAFKKELITDPAKHKHPGMILAKPSARGGGFLFSLIFTLASLLFLEKTPFVLGTTVAVFICGLIGLLDDFQNTAVKSKFKFMENPILRLVIFLPIPVLAMMAFGVVAKYINNPFNGNILLTEFTLYLGGQQFTPLPYVFTLIWTLAIMNVISWSNGVDGQFGGVAGISLLIIGVLALRLIAAEPAQLNTARMAFLASGISLGFIKYNWHPSKIMWGFGAVSVGLLLSALSITSRAKVATATMIILIPFLDGLITIVRRLVQGKNPLKGDRGHLHHLLLERGWSPQKVAVFYWIATAFFGLVALASAENSTALATLTLGGLVAAIIILLNVSAQFKKSKKDKAELLPLV
ncbi:undecaprenyl/decaprenyl-phosphate alpha-N-acetylglucosaminyl 1-phosphate transferase [Patescibacteria group bacterium]|nr:undecaprenyl/decaprenyl-phosphate alpha-N-acetylglucosaminyl 1-phosphate transferase [Patescibacteria group bacterium]